MPIHFHSFHFQIQKQKEKVGNAHNNEQAEKPTSTLSHFYIQEKRKKVGNIDYTWQADHTSTPSCFQMQKQRNKMGNDIKLGRQKIPHLPCPSYKYYKKKGGNWEIQIMRSEDPLLSPSHFKYKSKRRNCCNNLSTSSP